MAKLQKIIPNLWFGREAEEAAKFYTSVFKDSKIGAVTRYGKEGFEIHGMPEGTAMTVDFTIAGTNFVALNGGPHFKFNEAVSFIVECETQEEVDYFWSNLGEGGDPGAQQCGWLKDRFGLSWQVIPSILNKLIADKDQARSGRVMKAMLQMKKIEIEPLRRAYQGDGAAV